MTATLVPLGAFVAIAFCVWCALHYKNRDKNKIQDTVVKAIDAGQKLDPETIKALGIQSISPTFADLRRAVLLIGLGVAIIIFAQGIDDDEAPRIIMGLASFPIMLGIGYYVVYRLGIKESGD